MIVKTSGRIHFPPPPTYTGKAMTLCGKTGDNALSGIDAMITCPKCLKLYWSTLPASKKPKRKPDSYMMNLEEARVFRKSILKLFAGNHEEYRHCGKRWRVSKRFGLPKYLCPECGEFMKPKLLKKVKSEAR